VAQDLQNTTHIHDLADQGHRAIAQYLRIQADINYLPNQWYQMIAEDS